tara:strand:- start:796 stop:1803 length:1008 start_codon:yes stop_codon:yes gene_type:complete
VCSFFFLPHIYQNRKKNKMPAPARKCSPPAGKRPLAYTASGAAALMDGRPARRSLPRAADVCLLVIDPQLDFHDADRSSKRGKGSLAVRGATADSKRTAALLKRHGDRISRVVVTLDTHHKNHICHSCFWTDSNGQHPPPFTQITAAQVKSGAWTPVQREMRAWAVVYCEKLEAGKKFKHTIWPDHCLLGTPGHAVEPTLQAALDEWAQSQQSTITWLLKGQNCKTEMYSALSAEVPVPGDASTRLNKPLINSLTSHRKVLVCGQAKSHCVNQTFRDLASLWPRHRMQDLILLNNCTSPVAGFEKEAEKFEEFVRKSGCMSLRATELSKIMNETC